MSGPTDPQRRRTFLRGLGSIGAALTTGGALSGGGSARDTSSFEVSGHMIVRVEIRPDSVIRHTRRISPDLRRRYGIDPPVLTKTETIDRPDPDGDDLPMRDTRTERRPWETYYAKPDEWRDAFTGRGIGTQALDSGVAAESDHPYGIWEYEAVDGGYEVAAPMNVISPAATDDVVDVLDRNGWTTYVVQYDRHAWNSSTERFETQDASAATAPFGFLGRKHARCWEFGGYCSCSAHIDSAVPHEAVALDDAEQAIEGVFDDAADWVGFEDYYDTDNGSQLDHDGQATGLFQF